MDFGSIVSAIGGLQAASDIAKSMIGLRDAAALQSKTIELQNAILAAQTSALTAQSEHSLVERVRELEEKIVRMEAWNAEKQRYQMHEPVSGIFTYRLKDEEAGREPAHQICANCYNVHNKKSILQTDHLAVGRTTLLVCHNCKKDVVIRGLRQQGQ